MFMIGTPPRGMPKMLLGFWPFFQCSTPGGTLLTVQRAAANDVAGTPQRCKRPNQEGAHQCCGLSFSQLLWYDAPCRPPAVI